MASGQRSQPRPPPPPKPPPRPSRCRAGQVCGSPYALAGSGFNYPPGEVQRVERGPRCLRLHESPLGIRLLCTDSCFVCNFGAGTALKPWPQQAERDRSWRGGAATACREPPTWANLSQVFCVLESSVTPLRMKSGNTTLFLTWCHVRGPTVGSFPVRHGCHWPHVAA